MKHDNAMTGAAGVYYVCAELNRRGHIALPTLRQTKGVDIVASAADGHRQVELQVKTNRGSNRNWRLGEKAESLVRSGLFYVFVDMPEGEWPTYYIIPSHVVADWTRREHENWLVTPRRDGLPHPPTCTQRIFTKKAAREYRDRWDLLGLEDGEQA